jgi:protein-S-isoprenylcysteine O-methyltransferase Ste14
MNKFFVTLRALIYMTAFVMLWGWVALRVRVFDPRLGVDLPGWASKSGIFLILPGALLALACAAEFVARGDGTPAPFDAPRKFVATGPYRFVRNPMYVGGLTLLAGFGLYLSSVSILLLTLALFAFVHLFVIFYEEPTLRKNFGATYDDYCRSVSRWIPHRPKSPDHHESQAV